MMSQLNSQQLEAMQYIDGPLLVIAGAGSGKTRVITHKIAYLIEACQLSPKNIYAVTFTNKAAKEMQDRVRQIIPGTKKNPVPISTFHSLGLKILKQEGKAVHLNQNLTLFDAIDSMALIKELSEKITPISDENLKTILQFISSWKNDLCSPQLALENANNEQSHLAARFFAAYENTLQAYHAVDFDDLITLPVKIFQENPLVLEEWQNKIRYLLVDEYQDTNTAQYTLIKLLVGVRGALMVVGDDDQSIYAWRGAKPENIALLQNDFPALKVIKLEQNYRSTSNILRAANHLITHNSHVFEKNLWSTLGTGDPIKVIASSNDESEIEIVVHELISHQFRYRFPYCHYAILYRSNHQARNLEKALREQAIPYQISGGISFFSRTEIKDLFAYFRLMINPLDDAAFLRCVNTPKRDIGPATLEKLSIYAKQRQTTLFDACFEIGLREHLPEQAVLRLHDFATLISQTFTQTNSDECILVLNEFIKTIGYFEYLSDTSPTPQNAEKRIENVQDLMAWLKRLMDPTEKAHSFPDAINKMMLLDILDRQTSEQNNNTVQLMTLHAAKGLEFPHVIIMGWEEECLPHKNSIELEAVEEERRLAYVGMTRAQKTLILTYAKQRKRYGEQQQTTPSRFLSEIPAELLQFEGITEPTQAQKQATGQAHLAAIRALLQE